MQELTMDQAEQEKIHVEIVKLMAEQRKLNAEAGKMTRETFWYPVAVATGLIGSVWVFLSAQVTEFTLCARARLLT